MKKLTKMLMSTGLMLAIVALVMVGPGWASRGMGSGGGTGPITNILEGIPMTVTGTVVAVGFIGQPYQIDTGTEVVSVYGFGPLRFWNEIGIDAPAVGEEVMIEAYEVTFSDGTSKIIALSVTVGDTPVLLRDAYSGVPLWRGSGGGGSSQASAQGFPRGSGGARLRDGSCLSQ